MRRLRRGDHKPMLSMPIDQLLRNRYAALLMFVAIEGSILFRLSSSLSKIPLEGAQTGLRPA